MIDFLLRRRRAVLALAAMSAAALLPGLLELRSDNSPRVFFVRGSAAVDEYHRFLETFGPDSGLRLVVRGALDADALAWVARTQAEASALAGVRSASGPTGLPQLDPSFGWRRGRTATILLLLEDLAPPERDRLLDDLASLLASAPSGLDAEIVGLPMLNRALDRSAEEIGRTFFPLLIALAVLTVLTVVRDPRTLAAVLAYVGLCELTTLGVMSVAGVELNLILAILPPLLFAVSLATALHLLLAHRAHLAEGLDPEAAVSATYGEKGWAVLWTGATTATGFLSLAASPVAPIRDLGLWAGFGLAATTLLALVVYPALLASWARKAPRRHVVETAGRRLGLHWASWAIRRRKRVLGGALLIALLAAAGTTRLSVETDASTYLASGHPVRAAFERLDADEIGAASVEALLRRDAWTDDDFAALHELGRGLEKEPSIHGAVSWASFLAASRATLLPLPSDRLRAAREAFFAEEERLVRLTLFVPVVGAADMEPLLALVREQTKSTFPDAEVTLTGQLPTLLEAQRSLLGTLGVSFGWTFGVVSLIFWILLRDPRFTFLALLPNLWPVLGMFGVMALFRVPLDIATVMVASIALGLAVDDTIHSLGHFRKLRRSSSGEEAAVRTLELTGPAYLLSGVVLALGFGVCALSDFAPTARFGALAACAVFFAVLGDLLLVPALWSMLKSSRL